MNSRHHQNFNLKEFGNSTHFLYVSIIIIVLGHFSAVFSGGLSPWAGCPLFLFMKTAVFELKHEWDTWYVANLWADCDRFTWFLLRIHWVLEISRNKTFFLFWWYGKLWALSQTFCIEESAVWRGIDAEFLFFSEMQTTV